MDFNTLTTVFNNLQEVIFVLCGVVCFSAAIRGLKNDKNPYETFAFWFIIGIIFSFGKFINTAGLDKPTPGKPIPAYVVGILIVILGLLSAAKRVTVGKFENPTQQELTDNAKRVRLFVFVPALVLAVFAAIFSMVSFNFKAGKVTIPGGLAVGGAALIALFVAFIITRANIKTTKDDTDRLLMQVGTTSILPQLLIALGAVFTASGVGDVISQIFSSVIPEGNIFMGVLMYLIGMAIFTMIMGNGFAAFQVITIGVGIPFVIKAGGDPAIVSALALTGGFCGTLLTPMAANFNALPVSVLEMKDKYGVIKAQLPYALAMFVIHVVLMLVLAF